MLLKIAGNEYGQDLSGFGCTGIIAQCAQGFDVIEMGFQVRTLDMDQLMPEGFQEWVTLPEGYWDADFDEGKGDVLQTARIAGIQAAKRTSELIPMCHPVATDVVNIEASLVENRVWLFVEAVASGRTGVEMEALTATQVALLTVYDMCKAMSHDIVIGDNRLRVDGQLRGQVVDAEFVRFGLEQPVGQCVFLPCVRGYSSVSGSTPPVGAQATIMT